MWRCTFSMTTMASSTTSPVASVIPNSVSELIEKSEELDERECSDQRDRNRDRRNDGRAPVQQEEEDHEDDDDDRFSQRHQHFANRVAHDRRRIESDRIFKARRKALRLVPVRAALALRSTSSAFAFVELLHADALRCIAVVLQLRAVVFRANLGVAHILEQNQSVAVCSEMMLLNCAGS